MSRQLNPAQMWSQQPLASRTASVIKSIQQGTVTVTAGNLSATATISSVTTAKTVLMWMGTNTAATISSSNLVRLDLTNATTVTLTRGASSLDCVGGFQVVEFY